MGKAKEEWRTGGWAMADREWHDKVLAFNESLVGNPLVCVREKGQITHGACMLFQGYTPALLLYEVL
jgi:hypothetical protein